ncbi:MAG: class I SAM-dependent methyltransferase [Parcubacteria group bacterium]
MKITEKFKNHQKKWARISKHWGNFTEPSRPSRGDIANYNSLLSAALKNRKNPDILLLGSTPEIRDVLFKFSMTHGAKVICADMTREMFDAMSALTDFKNAKEKFVSANWVDMRFDKKFDVIIGDFVNGNIGDRHKHAYFSNLVSLLKEDGSFITRDCVFTDECKIGSVEQAFRSFLNQARDEEYPMKKAANMAANTLIWASRALNDERKGSLSYFWPELEKFGEKLDSARSEDDILLKIMYQRMMRAWTPYKSKYWTYNTFEENKRMLEGYFIIKKTLFADDYGKIITKASPMYLLGKQ